ncbi:thiamine-phosphate kinase [Salinisphaera sp. Q1T1-3]|uniref:thiamine-phosphate kinase n=1 Tax=Salinisphaera sp. Q1T1-3 TaxID=2321229 RepID=UPI001F1F402E|nr:thiamine-phosphate kinase [Salinisphaera sp. Q1T1-3]
MTTRPGPVLREFELVDLLRARLAARRDDTRIGIGDDAAVLRPCPGHDLVATTDTLISGRHFPDDTSAFDVGYKALAVNLSDVAAMGAEPAWLTVSLSAPSLSRDWCERFIDGMQAACRACPTGTPIDIVGGDTTRTDTLTISVTALGQVAAGAAMHRAGAQAGQAIAVTGTLGDAAAGLRCWPQRATASTAQTDLIKRLTRPDLRRGSALIGQATSAIDISDGLLADLGHILAASGVGATIRLDALPYSTALASVVPEAADRQRLQATGGDDYELCVTMPLDARPALETALGCPLTVIGQVETRTGLRCLDGAGNVVAPDTLGAPGWDHFGMD